MIALSHSSPHSHSEAHDAYADPFVHDPDTEPPASLTEPPSAAETARRQFWALTPPPATLGMVVGGAAAVLGGGAVGYWLGRRSAPRPPKPVRRAGSSITSMVELAPVAMQLLANPIVRALVIRVLVRKISARMPI